MNPLSNAGALTNEVMVQMLVDAEGEDALNNTRGSMRAAIEQELQRRKAREANREPV